MARWSGGSAHPLEALRPSLCQFRMRRSGPDHLRGIVVDWPRRASGGLGNEFKCLGYANELAARRRAFEMGADIAIMLGSDGNVVCADTANLYIVTNQVIVTPKISSGALPGTVRAALPELLEMEGYKYRGGGYFARRAPTGRRCLPHQRIPRGMPRHGRPARGTYQSRHTASLTSLEDSAKHSLISEDTVMPSNDLLLSPSLGVLAVVIHKGRLLLARRTNEPDAGCWGFPGGYVERGETLAEAAVRGIARRDRGFLRRHATSSTRSRTSIPRKDGRVAHHFVLVALRCEWISGEPKAVSDVNSGPVDCRG